MFYAKVMRCIGQHLFDLQESFELEVFDSVLQKYIDFDEEYAEELRRTTNRRIIKGRILINKMDLSSISINDSPSSPLSLPVNSPQGMTVFDDLRPITPDIDIHVCRYDEPFMEFDDDTERKTCITFVRDVAEFQRMSFLTECPQLMNPKKDRFITRIQGVKTEFDSQYACVLPEIKLPLECLEHNQIQISVSVVLESHGKDLTNWFLSTTQGFLYDDTERNSTPYNPIHLNIDRSACTDDGIYKLPLRMCTFAGHHKNNRGRIFHTLHSKFAEKLHTAKYQPNTPRLACVLSDENHNIYWKTFGLSNFMQPKKSKTQYMINRSPLVCNNKTPVSRCNRRNKQALKRLF